MCVSRFTADILSRTLADALLHWQPLKPHIFLLQLAEEIIWSTRCAVNDVVGNVVGDSKPVTELIDAFTVEAMVSFLALNDLFRNVVMVYAMACVPIDRISHNT